MTFMLLLTQSPRMYNKQKGLALDILLHDKQLADIFCSFDLKQTKVQPRLATVMKADNKDDLHAVGFVYDSCVCVEEKNHIIPLIIIIVVAT